MFKKWKIEERMYLFIPILIQSLYGCKNTVPNLFYFHFDPISKNYLFILMG